MMTLRKMVTALTWLSMGIAIIDKPTPTLDALAQFGISPIELGLGLIISSLFLAVGAILKRPVYAFFYAPFVLYMSTAITLLDSAPFFIYISFLTVTIIDYIVEVLEWKHKAQSP